MKWVKCSNIMPELDQLVLTYNGETISEGLRYSYPFDNESNWDIRGRVCHGDSPDPIYWSEYPELPRTNLSDLPKDNKNNDE